MGVKGFEHGGVTQQYEYKSLEGIPANEAPVYSASSTYAVGDFVLYEGTLYRCKTAIATAEAWTAAHWEAANLASELTQLKEDLSELGLSVVDGELCVVYNVE